MSEHIGRKNSENNKISQYSKWLIEQGQELLLESISVTRDASRIMISISLSAIPIFLGLLELKYGSKAKENAVQNISSLLPPAMFLCSSILYLIAYLPITFNIDLRVPNSIITARQRLVKKRLNMLYVAS